MTGRTGAGEDRAGRDPLVTVVTATYNRSAVLRCAIESLRRSRFEDWEQVVVGDACTDDTAAVVAAFGDPRLRFVNLPRNCGEQAGPNNEGLRLARGRFVAYLNHDDLWFPDHLETMVRTIEATGADLAYARAIVVGPDGGRSLLGTCPGGRYRPVGDIQASLWLHRRELAAEIGGWRLSRRCRAVPSQDFLIRAWRRGAKIVAADRVTVLQLPANKFRDCYRTGTAALHEELLARMEADPGFREAEVTRAGLEAMEDARSLRPARHLRGLVRAAAYRACLALGIAPVGLKYVLKSPRRGAFLRRHRRFRGLDRPPEPGS